MEEKTKGFIVTLRREASMAPEEYYMLGVDRRAAVRAARRICKAPYAIILDVTSESGSLPGGLAPLQGIPVKSKTLPCPPLMPSTSAFRKTTVAKVGPFNAPNRTA